MGYFEGWINAAFKKNEGDQTVYYPFGIFGCGYVLTDKVTEDKARFILRRYFEIGIFLLIVALYLTCLYVLQTHTSRSFKIVTWISIFLLLLPGIWAYYKSKVLVAGCPREEKRLTLKESCSNSALAHNFWDLWFSFVFSVTFASCALLLAMYARTFKFVLIGWLGVGIFTFSAFVNGYMLKVKEADIKRKSKD